MLVLVVVCGGMIRLPRAWAAWRSNAKA